MQQLIAMSFIPKQNPPPGAGVFVWVNVSCHGLVLDSRLMQQLIARGFIPNKNPRLVQLWGV